MPVHDKPILHLMIANRRIWIALLALLFSAMLAVSFGILFLPRSLVKSRACSMPFRDALLSDVCSSSMAHQGASDLPLRTSSGKIGLGETVNMATSIYVVSLARRTDRRRIMQLLKEALGLDWNYFDALDKDDPLIDNIMLSVARQRANATSSNFRWPDNLEDAQRQSLELETLAYDDLDIQNAASLPLLCATGDNEVPLYSNSSSVPFHKRLSRGMIACWYSHMRLMMDIVKRTSHFHEESWDGREGITVVFEDDIDIEWDLKERIEKMWVDLPRDWDIIMLGHCWSNESTYPPIMPTSPLHPSHSPKCTHGYVLSPFGARRVLSHLIYAPFAFSRALDQAIAHLISTRRIRSFSVVPSIVVQRRCPLDNSTECHYGSADDGDSDIWVNGGRKGSRWRDSLEDSTLERVRKGVVRLSE